MPDQSKPRQAARGPRQYHHGDLRRVLVEVAGELLEERGPEAVSFRAMARQAGVSQTAPYNHFRSKEHLLATVSVLGLQALTASQRKAAMAASGTASVVAMGVDYVRFALERPQRYRLMFGVGLSGCRDDADVEHAKGASFEPLRGVLAANFGPPVGPATADDLEDMAVSAWALVHGLSMLLIDGGLTEFEAPDQAMPFVERLLSRFAASLGAWPSAAAAISPPDGRPSKRR